jgi:hypothetical protein
MFKLRTAAPPPHMDIDARGKHHDRIVGAPLMPKSDAPPSPLDYPCPPATGRSPARVDSNRIYLCSLQDRLYHQPHSGVCLRETREFSERHIYGTFQGITLISCVLEITTSKEFSASELPARRREVLKEHGVVR